MTNGLDLKLNEVFIYTNGVQSNHSTSSQSSTFGTQDSSLAIDGNTTTYSLTDNDTAAWWSTTLDTSGYVDTITIHEYTPNCNLKGAVMTLFDNSGTKVATRTIESCGVINERFQPVCTCK
eukprot:scaffold280308_cov162-Cyclotella_meneghiniana.AAC.2